MKLQLRLKTNNQTEFTSMHLALIDKIHFLDVHLSPPLFVDDEVVVGQVLEPHLGGHLLLVLPVLPALPVLPVLPVLLVVDDRHARLGVGLCYFLAFTGLRSTAHLNYLFYYLLSITSVLKE